MFGNWFFRLVMFELGSWIVFVFDFGIISIGVVVG